MACLFRYTTGALCPRRVVHGYAPRYVLDMVAMHCEAPRMERRRSMPYLDGVCINGAKLDTAEYPAS